MKLDANSFKNIITKKEHFFSRIHVLDISRLITYILFNSSKNETWNLVDDLPTTRKTFVERLIQLKKVKKYNLKTMKILRRVFLNQKESFGKQIKKLVIKK